MHARRDELAEDVGGANTPLADFRCADRKAQLLPSSASSLFPPRPLRSPALGVREALINPPIVVPAKAGTQATEALLDPRLRGDDT